MMVPGSSSHHCSDPSLLMLPQVPRLWVVTQGPAGYSRPPPTFSGLLSHYFPHALNPWIQPVLSPSCLSLCNSPWTQRPLPFSPHGYNLSHSAKSIPLHKNLFLIFSFCPFSPPYLYYTLAFQSVLQLYATSLYKSNFQKGRALRQFLNRFLPQDILHARHLVFVKLEICNCLLK